MKKFAGSLVAFLLVLFLCSSNLWAGDSEIRTDPTDTVTLPLTEHEVAPPAIKTPEESIPEAAPLAVEAEEVVTEAVLPTEPEAVVEEVVGTVEPPVVVPPPPAPKDDLTIAAELIEMEGLANYKKALDLCMKAVEKDPNNFKANWLCAEACREYGLETEHLDLDDWKDICIKYSTLGRKCAEKAITLQPRKPNGYYFYGLNVGIYADAVSIFTALKEGLKNKTQENFEIAYKLDKTFDTGGPIVAIGRFWHVLPWVAGGDEDKALEFYREYQKTEFFSTPDGLEGHIYLAEILMDSRKTKEEAKQLLQEASKLTNDKFWQNRIKELNDDM
jgi:hypothetical protein